MQSSRSRLSPVCVLDGGFGSGAVRALNHAAAAFVKCGTYVYTVEILDGAVLSHPVLATVGSLWGFLAETIIFIKLSAN